MIRRSHRYTRRTVANPRAWYWLSARLAGESACHTYNVESRDPRLAAAGHSVFPDRRAYDYNDRRKFKTSCFWEELRPLNFPTTACASELQFWPPEEGAAVWGPPEPEPQACASIACNRSEVRPSCRKKSRWPSPHKGAVRNS